MARSRRQGSHPPGGDAHALTYVRAVDRKVMGRGTCRPVSAALPAVRQGTPNRALLSLLGVLHRPARPTDKLPAALRQNASHARETYIHYIRLARVTAGVSYYVVPADSTFRGTTFGSACYAALRTAMRAELAHVPPQLHSRVLALQGQEIARLQALSQQAAQGGVCLMSNSQYANGGTCGATASQIARHGLLSVYGYISGVVPDGVASVTLQLSGGERFAEPHRYRRRRRQRVRDRNRAATRQRAPNDDMALRQRRDAQDNSRDPRQQRASQRMVRR